METVKISNKYWLSQQPINKPDQPIKLREKVNHIWIYDRSGSMTWLLPSLAQDLIKHYQTVPEGDMISIGYFSGVGVYRFIVKGFVKADKKIAEDAFAKIINQNSSPIGTTCFSEILADANTVVQELAPFCDNFALMFFTDGYPVVPDYRYELSQIFKAIDNIKGKLSRAIFVGYGDYYNRELLSKMTVAAGGALIHSSTLPEFSEPMAMFVGGEITPRYRVLIPADINDNLISVFTIDFNGESITQYDEKLNEIFVDVGDGIKYVYFITTEKPKDTNMTTPMFIESGMYASGLILSQRLQADATLEVMGRLGDVAIIDQLNSSFTNDEFGQVENTMRKAVFDVKERYTEGKRLGYVPRRDRFCVLNLIEQLQSDKDAMFYPYSPAFHYKRIGAKTRQKDGYPLFTTGEPNPACALNTITWNATRMNISLLARITGYITLSDDCGKYGFSKTYPTWIYRNFSIVTDGVLHTQHMPISCSKATFDVLVKNKLVKKDVVWAEGEVYDLDLKKLPVMNRMIADDAMSAHNLCNRMVDEKMLEAKAKVLKWKRNELDPEKTVSAMPLSEAQKKYLESQGITNNGFNPPKEELPPTDFYIAQEFEVKMAKFSSLPSVEKTIYKDTNKLTVSEKAVYDAWMEVPGNLRDAKSTDENIKYAVLLLDNLIEMTKHQLREARNDIYRTKASVLLGKRWFPDLTDREGAEVKVLNHLGEFNFTFTMRDIRVDL